MQTLEFEWDSKKDAANQRKHGVSFEQAQAAFGDPFRIVAIDHDHSTPGELRYYCFGRVARGVMTVRFTYRDKRIRIIGAGYWREGRKAYEKAYTPQ